MTTEDGRKIRKSDLKVGVISDTHGLLRPDVFTAFEGVELILHAGDIGGDDILIELQAIAPVLAVRGNMDHGAWQADIPASREVMLGNNRIFLVHDPAHVDFDPATKGFQGVVFGHTHRPHLETHAGVLMLNPGSAGHRRSNYPISLAILKISGEGMRAELMELPCDP
jgi:putative phosphoesterase